MPECTKTNVNSIFQGEKVLSGLPQRLAVPMVRNEGGTAFHSNEIATLLPPFRRSKFQPPTGMLTLNEILGSQILDFLSRRWFHHKEEIWGWGQLIDRTDSVWRAVRCDIAVPLSRVCLFQIAPSLTPRKAKRLFRQFKSPFVQLSLTAQLTSSISRTLCSISAVSSTIALGWLR